MKKRAVTMSIFLALVLALALALLPGGVKGAGEIKVFSGNRQLSFEVKPRIVQGRVLVPLRDIFQALGADISWNEKTNTVVAKKDERKIEIALGQKMATINGENVKLDVPPLTEKKTVLVPLRFVGEALNVAVEWNPQTKTVVIQEQVLPAVGSFERLKELLAASESSRAQAFKGFAVKGSAERANATAAVDQAAAPAAKSEADAGSGYSSTNVQVQGVDEADIVKTDGTYIYQVNRGRVIVALASPPDQMKIIDTISFAEETFSPQELYVDEKYLVVIGSADRNIPLSEPKVSGETKIYPPVSVTNTTKAIIFHITDKNHITRVREVELDGIYVSSRKIGSRLYLVANKNLDYYHIMQGQEEETLPSYRDSAQKNQFVEIPYRDIRYFPGCIEPNYLLVAGLNLDTPEEKMAVSSYLGSGENIYATEENLYVAVTGYRIPEEKKSADIAPAPEPSSSFTTIYRFALGQEKAEYDGKGEVPGTILNQFSMDEYRKNFRIATTTGEIWRSDEFTSKNHLYILDENLNIAGKIEDMAPGEKIYSVRFLGDRGYVVTFKKVDPLFVIDLERPEAPKILGSLKIPGYSDYLHPYDENHIIGFGKDTVELSQKDGTGKETDTRAFYQGMKIALFDVSDVSHPVQISQEIIGDRGTDSELLSNHKALLFSREKDLMAFPVTVREIKDKSTLTEGIPQYGEFSFQGAYIYQIDLKDGFKLKGRITHLSASDLEKAGSDWYSSDKNIDRIIYIGNSLYTLSQGMIKAHKLTDLKEIGSLPIPE